jgi:hypothetical protein
MADTDTKPRTDQLTNIVEQWELEMMFEENVPCDFPDHGKYNGKIPPCSGHAVAFARIHGHTGTWCEASVKWITGIEPVINNIKCVACHEPFNNLAGHPSVTAI